ncbi:DNA polymerase Y family protein [Microterricola viridarii]|uniref:UmuC domain-containing protein n=1 Tax=Microterricola viridarii TaxID=412690 RepID=A0A0X8E2H2_9MICO|nr:DNA polymerase Y family protein [Microterricola viridarii]AMB58492.1 hypothetical protein AWU67_06050 [Microterricola viridarii]
MQGSEKLGRTIVLWLPDWPVTAARQLSEPDEAGDPAAPLALIEHGLVFACSAAARAAGVQRGLKLREAQSRCPDLLTVPYDPAHDARAFEPILAQLEQLVPGVQLIRPGTVAIRARGPVRFYGGEEQAAAALLDGLNAHGSLGDAGEPGVRVGIADGPFAAGQAARATTAERPVLLIPEGASAAFLAPFPIGILVDTRMGTLLRRLGVTTLGEFAALPAVDVHRRFGAIGAEAHALAGAADGRVVVARTVPKDFDAVIEFEPPLDIVEQVAFGIRAAADEFVEALTRSRLVCTAIQVQLVTERGTVSERSWLHPRWFTAADVVDRVRWQLQGGASIGSGLRSGIARVRVSPERVDSTGNHEQGLWGTGPDERIHHGLTRVQSMLGHEGVGTAVIAGGRMLAERAVFVPWGDAPPPAAPGSTGAPWPGSLSGMAPATVFSTTVADRQPVTVLDEHGDGVDVDARGMLSGTPASLGIGGAAPRGLRAWAGPWPVVERWWDAASARRLYRFQMVDAAGMAWLLAYEINDAAIDSGTDALWWAEAKYD